MKLIYAVTLSLLITSVGWTQVQDLKIINELSNSKKTIKLIIYNDGELEVQIKGQNKNTQTFIDLYQIEDNVAVLNDEGDENGVNILINGEDFVTKWLQLKNINDKGEYNMDILITNKNDKNEVTSRYSETIKFGLN